MKHEKEYQKRRRKLLQKLPKNSISVLGSAAVKIRSNDTEYPYRQNSNFYYLSGFEEENAFLIFVKEKKRSKTVLFVQEKEKLLELWSGKRLGVKKAKKQFLVDEVYSSDKFEKKLKEYLQNKHTLYYDFQTDNPKFLQLLPQITSKLYGIKNIAKKIESLRAIKSKSEIKLIKNALKITKKAHHQAMKVKKTALYEYQLQAEFEYIFKKYGAYSDAYTTIVAGGDNANTLHYIKNDQKLKKEDLILIDAGCEYNYYASDITRTIPVGGKFSKAQKELYTLVLHVEEKIISMIKEGVKRSFLQKEAEKLLTKGMIKLGILQGSVKKCMKKKLHKKYFPHGIGHYMGIDVHDQNPYKTKDNKEIPLQAGMVLTIEPGIYLPKDDKNIPKKYRGIGIRIEDNILVTKKGFKNLSKDIVKSVKDIETLTKS